MTPIANKFVQWGSACTALRHCGIAVRTNFVRASIMEAS